MCIQKNGMARIGWHADDIGYATQYLVCTLGIC